MTKIASQNKLKTGQNNGGAMAANLSKQFIPYIHYNKQVETAFIGACLLESDCFPQAKNIIKPEFFYTELYRHLYQALLEMWEHSIRPDILTLNSFIHQHWGANHPIWALVGGHPSEPNSKCSLPYDITVTTNHVVSGAHLAEWVLVLTDCYIERCLVEQSNLLTNPNRDGSVRQKLQEIRTTLDHLDEFKRQDNDILDTTTMIFQLLQHMTEVEGKDVPGIPSGFSRFDHVTGGFYRTGVFYLAARPAMGKSALMLAMILWQIQQGIPVFLISLEMKANQMMARIVSMIANIPFRKIWRNKLTKEEKKIVDTYFAALSQMPLFAADSPGVTMDDIRALYMKMKRAWHKRLQDLHGADWKKTVPENERDPIVWIDYLQLVTPEEAKNKNREQEVAKISRGLKMLAMKENIPVIALAQLSRNADGRKPKLSDLRESGSLEQDADGVMLLHRPFQMGEDKDKDGNSTEKYGELNVAKWRNGEVFIDKLHWEGSRMEFREMTDQEAAEYTFEEEDPF
jgi:replicative DNA helicase